jgi:hypothetical protein
MRVDYHVQRHNPDDHTDKFTEAETAKESAHARLKHISAIFGLLKMVDIESRWTNQEIVTDRLETLSDAISDIGDLGQAISDGLYCPLDELFDLYERQAEIVDKVTTLGVEDETEVQR